MPRRWRARTDDATSLALGAAAFSALAGRHDKALVMLERALARNPSSAIAEIICAMTTMMLAQPEDSAAQAERTKRPSPFDPLRHLPEAFLVVSHLAADRPATAPGHARRCVEADPGFPPGHVTLALCLMALDRIEQARAALAEGLRLAPDTRVARLPERYLPINGLGVARVVAEMRVAGLPEQLACSGRLAAEMRPELVARVATRKRVVGDGNAEKRA